jgi:hypothetical protein
MDTLGGANTDSEEFLTKNAKFHGGQPSFYSHMILSPWNRRIRNW